MTAQAASAVRPRAQGFRLPRAQAVFARAGLALVACAGAWLAVASATDDWITDTSSVSEPHWLRGPLGGLLPPLRDTSFSLLLVAMLAGYLLVVGFAKALPDRAALVVAMALAVLFAFAPVILSADLFGYVAYARLAVIHHLNPYAHLPIAAPRDPVLPLVYWQHASSPYGPLYTLASFTVGGTSIPVAVWSLKTLSSLSCLAALGVIARAAPRYGRAPGRAATIVGCNPLLLAYGVGGGHNDLVAMAAVAAALLWLTRSDPGHERAAGAMLAVAAGLKLTGGLLAPFALVGRPAGRRPFRGLLTGLLAGAAGIAAVTAAVFGTGAGRQLVRIAGSSEFVAPYSGPDALSHLLGTGPTGGVRLACAAVALLVFAACLWRARQSRDWLGDATLAGAALLCAVPSLAPWYLAWVLPAAALARGRAGRMAVASLTVVITLTHLPVLGFDAY
jgi:hypothetical protein